MYTSPLSSSFQYIISKTFVFIITILIVILFGCNTTFSGNYENTPEGNYDFFFHELNNIYAYRDFTFENGLSLNEIQEIERAKLLANPTWDNLSEVLNNVVYEHIRDPHVNWIYPTVPISFIRTFWNSIKEKRGEEFDGNYPSSTIIVNPLVTTIQTDFMNYAIIPATNDKKPIGYIYITKLERSSNYDIGEENQKIASTIDSILRHFQNKGADRIIVDIRSDAGGSAYFAEIIASRFINKTTKYAIYKEHTSKNSLSEQNKYISPNGYSYFQDKPLVVLVNSLTCSAGEILLLMLRQSGGTHSVIGTPTLGCPGSTLYRELPNGWIFQVTINFSYEEDGRDYFKKGINPDIITNTINESYNVDGMLDLAIDTVRSFD